MNDTSAFSSSSTEDFPAISPPRDRSFSDLRLLTPPRLADLGTAGVDAQLDVFRLKGELSVSHFQVKNRDESLGRIHRIVAEKEALLAAERQKVELLTIQVMELQLRIEAGSTGKLEKQLERMASELLQAKADVATTKVIKEADGNTRIIMETVRDRELDILSMREALHTTQMQVSNAQQEVRRLTSKNREMEDDIKSLLERRSQVQSLKTELLRMKHLPVPSSI